MGVILMPQKRGLVDLPKLYEVCELTYCAMLLNILLVIYDRV